MRYIYIYTMHSGIYIFYDIIKIKLLNNYQTVIWQSIEEEIYVENDNGRTIYISPKSPAKPSIFVAI